MIACVIHQNSTSLSECRNFSCWYTKGHLWIEVFPEHYSLAYYEIHSASIQLITLPHFCHVRMYARLSILTTHASIASLPCSNSRILVCAGCSYIYSRIIRGLLYCRPANVFLNISILKHVLTGD